MWKSPARTHTPERMRAPPGARRNPLAVPASSRPRLADLLLPPGVRLPCPRTARCCRTRCAASNGAGDNEASSADEHNQTPAWDAFRHNGNAASPGSSSNGASSVNWDDTWATTGFPRYMTRVGADAKTSDGGTGRANGSARSPAAADDAGVDSWDWGYVRGDRDHFDPVWTAIRAQAEQESKDEPLLSSFLYSTVLSHDSFEKALANVLANRICDSTLLPTQLFPTFLSSLRKGGISDAARLDIQVTKDRDPACQTYLEALLYYKGFHALQVHRIAHDLWETGHEIMACMLQARCSEAFGVDIHPGAQFGRGILIDHASGVVVGETAVVGDYTSLLQGVTLGGTGKATGDRHPKIGRNVLLGAQATVLGNIAIGDGAMVAAGSVVLKSFPSNAMVAGIPASCVGSTCGMPASSMDQCDGWRDSYDEGDGKPGVAAPGVQRGGGLGEGAGTQDPMADYMDEDGIEYLI